ncbi:MAG: nuclear transport factor 2 family protein [Nocardioides sp.]
MGLTQDAEIDLQAVERIRVLKYRYFRALDLKAWDDFGATLAEDATAHYGTKVYGEPLDLHGRDAITDFMRENVAADMITVHVANHPDIEVDGLVAQGSWCFEDTVIVPGHDVLIRGAGYYQDRYVHTPHAGWLIAETTYERIFESIQSTAELPGFRLLANRWADPAASGALGNGH